MINAGVFAQSLNAPKGIAAAVQQASAKTGVDFSYLLTQAKVESSFKADAKAGTSSATGLYQFIEQTWLRQVYEHGAEHGKADWASAIKQGSDGKFRVSSPETRQAILNARTNPEFSALMAGELAAENKGILESKISRDVNATDLYMAHFLGAGGASTFLSAMEKNPLQTATTLFPDAARANRSVFYDGARARSLSEVYEKFSAKFDNETPVTVAKAESVIARPDPAEMRIAKTKPVVDMPATDVLALLDAPSSTYTTNVRAFTSAETPEAARIQTMIGGDLLSGPLLALIGGMSETNQSGAFKRFGQTENSADRDRGEDDTLRALSMK